MSKPNDAGHSARTGEDESHQEKSTDILGRVADGALAGAVVGGLYGLAELLGRDTRDRGYYAERDGERVELTYVPEVGEERPAASVGIESAEELLGALVADDGESEGYWVESKASGEVLEICDKKSHFNFSVMHVLADDRDSLVSELRRVLDATDEEGSADV